MYHMDFDMAVNYLKSFIEDGSSDCRNLSSARQNDNEGKGNTKDGKLKVEARFYKPSEWVKLSFNEQQKVCNLQVKHAKAQQKHKSAQAKVNDDDEKQDKWFVEFLGLPPLIPVLQCVNRLGFEIFSVNSHQSEQGS